MDQFEQAWQRRFGRAAEKYDSDHARSGWSEEGLQRRLAAFIEAFEAADLPAGLEVLDLGCGAGTYSAWLAGRGHRVVALDYSLKALKHAAERPGRTVSVRAGGAVIRPGEMCLIAGEAYHLPVAPGAFDCVVCVGVFQTLDRPRACLAEMRRVLRPAGTLFLMTLNASDVRARLARAVRPRRAGYDDLRRYDPAGLKRLLGRAGFRVEEGRGVYLLPDRAAGLSRSLACRGVFRGLGRFGTAPIHLAHAVLFVARAV